MQSPKTPDDQTFFERLLAVRSEAIPVAHDPTVQFNDGTKPKANCCHDNASRFSAENAGHAVVHGWIITELPGFHPLHKIIAHSVIESAGRGMFDITPLGDERERPSLRFIRHPAWGPDFDVIRQNNSHVFCAPAQ